MIPYFFIPTIDIGIINIPTFPFFHGLGFAIMGILVLYEGRRRGADVQIYFNVFFFALVGGLVGARIGGILTNLDFFVENPAQIFNFAQGGWTEAGGAAGGFLFALLYAKKRIRSVKEGLDIFAPALTARFGISRFGCGAMHDHMGKVMERDWPWGIEYNGEIRHETGIYSLFANAVIFFILWKLRKRIKTPGLLFGIYLLMYSASIFIIRFFRAEDLEYISNVRYAGLTQTQYIMIAVFTFGIFFIWKIRQSLENKKIDILKS
jgi:phosphatidylglycerol:prolipoprotein diacylglycerol transferase